VQAIRAENMTMMKRAQNAITATQKAVRNPGHSVAFFFFLLI
jgi:hypothetical protein